MIAALVGLAAQIERCAPQVAPSTMMAIVRVESGGDSLAIHDNSVGRSYHPHDRLTAEAIARALLDAGHLLDLGIAQISSMNLLGQGLDVQSAFDACANLGAGARILSYDYAFATTRYGPGQVALRHAIGMYNTGSLDAGRRYVKTVLLAAGISGRDSSACAVAANDPKHSPLLIPVTGSIRITNRERLGVTQVPSRAPILIHAARSTGIVF